MDRPRIVSRPAFAVVGITERTSNRDESDPISARIPDLWDRFLRENPTSPVPHKLDPETIIALYSDYESGDQGPYSITIGCAVHCVDTLPRDVVARRVPAATYAVITSDTGQMPAIVINAWKGIWAMSPEELGGRRSYTGDFEVYDRRSRNPENAQIEICIAIRQD